MAERRNRTPEEREAARLERERRRTGRNHDEPAAAPQPPPPAPEPPPQPPRAEPPPQPPRAELPPQPPPRDEPPPQPPRDELPPPAAPLPDPAPGFDAPAGTRRVSRGSRLTGKPRQVKAGRPLRPSRPHSRRRRLLALIPLAIGIALLWFLVELFQPFHGSPRGRVTVTIPAHAGSGKVGDLLASRGVVSSGFFFRIRAALSGDQNSLRAGTYHLQLGMSYAAALTALTTPPPVAKTTPITMTPGETRRKFGALLKSQGVKGDYFKETLGSKLLDPHRFGAPKGTHQLEGFLFPDTYQLRDPVSIPALIADQLKQFRKEFATVNLKFAHSKNLTGYDVLTIASMVEAESATAHDRPLVAAVIYNRLHDGMPLQIDATTRYQYNDYTKALTNSQLASSSPYNTRIHKGLPPTPIDNPGLAAIQAAARPAKSNALYFVVKPCGNGEMTFTANYRQFLADSARYNNARNARGGRSPEHCK
jgi:UPF0755 protein